MESDGGIGVELQASQAPTQVAAQVATQVATQVAPPSQAETQLEAPTQVATQLEASLLPPTQVEVPSQVATQVETQVATQSSSPSQADAPTQVAVPRAVPPADARCERCPVCALDVTARSVLGRTEHVNACLDAIAGRSARGEAAGGTGGSSPTDPTPSPSPSPATAAASSADSGSGNGDDHGTGRSEAASLLGGGYRCKICGRDLSERSVDARIRHVKQCGQRFGVRPSDLAAAGATVAAADRAPIHSLQSDAPPAAQGEEPRDAFAVLMAPDRPQPSGGASNAFDVMMKSSRTASVAGALKRQRGDWRGAWRAGGGGRGGGPGRRRAPRCPEFKRVKGTAPPFIVDGFAFASRELSSVYFLTHFHSDHYGGLTKAFDCGVVYCNEVTAQLVQQELGVAARLVHPLPMGRPAVVEGVEVTCLDANHCPGAAMLLFRLRDGRAFLHTGDFRFDRSMLATPALRPFAAGGRRLDGVYLDTTYANPRYSFPTREAAIAHALGLLERHHARQPDAGGPPELDAKTLFLFGAYSLGKERLFMEVAARLQRKVCVSTAKLRVLSALGWPPSRLRLLTTAAGATNLHVVPMQDLQMAHLTALLEKHRLRFRRVVAFRPTGWTFGGGGSSGAASCATDPSGRVRVYGVPYSEHSSFPELVDCLRALNPREIIPTVNCASEQQARRQVDALKQAAGSSLERLFRPQQEALGP